MSDTHLPELMARRYRIKNDFCYFMRNGRLFYPINLFNIALICTNYLNHNISDIFHNYSVVIYAYKNYVMDSGKVMILLKNVVHNTSEIPHPNAKEETNW